MTTIPRRREDIAPEQAGTYLLGVLLAGVRTGIYRLLFNFYVLSQGYEEGLITVLITASAMATVASVLPLSYIVDYVGKKQSLFFSIAGTIISLLVMILFPSRLMFLMLNMILGMCQALTQVSLGSDDSRYMKLMDRVMYYSLPLVFATFTNYIVIYLPKWMGVGRGALDHETEITAIGIITVALFVFIDSQYNNFKRGKTPKRVIASFNVGGISIPLILDDDDEYEEEFTPFASIAEQVNFILQGVLLDKEYSGPEIQITENLDGDLLITIEDEAEYIGVEMMPEGEAKTLVQCATDLWVKQNLKE